MTFCLKVLIALALTASLETSFAAPLSTDAAVRLHQSGTHALQAVHYSNSALPFDVCELEGSLMTEGSEVDDEQPVDSAVVPQNEGLLASVARSTAWLSPFAQTLRSTIVIGLPRGPPHAS